MQCLLTHVVPYAVEDIQEHCTVVVWKQPAKANGYISHYVVTFTRDNMDRSVVTDAVYHYHVIQSGDIPAGDGPVTVQVARHTSDAYIPTVYIVPHMCIRYVLTLYRHCQTKEDCRNYHVHEKSPLTAGQSCKYTGTWTTTKADCYYWYVKYTKSYNLSALSNTIINTNRI